MNRIIFIYFASIFFVSCNDSSEVRYYSVEKKINNNAADSSSVNKNSNVGLDFIVPNGWVASNGSSIRLASFNVPFDGGVGDLSVIRLGGQAGGNLANVNRWRDQLGLSEIDEITLRGMENNEKGLSGTYKWYKIINENEPSSSFLCSIIEETTTTLFVKLNIPIPSIEEVQEQFISFCSSIKSNQ